MWLLILLLYLPNSYVLLVLMHLKFPAFQTIYIDPADTCDLALLVQPVAPGNCDIYTATIPIFGPAVQATATVELTHTVASTVSYLDLGPAGLLPEGRYDVVCIPLLMFQLTSSNQH